MENTETQNFVFTRENFKWIIIGLIVVILGYILMAGGGATTPFEFTGGSNADPGLLFNFRRLTLSPIVVISGYGLILYGILKKSK